MKKWILIPLVVTLILPLCTQGLITQEVPPVVQEIANKIQQAVQSYRDDKVIEGATLLCDVVLMTRPRSSWPEGFAEAVDSAKDSFQKANFPEGVGHVKKAITIFKPGKTSPSSKDAGQLGSVAQAIMNTIRSAVENFQAGNADLGVLQILESLALLAPQS